jgi:hypothetical protein
MTGQADFRAVLINGVADEKKPDGSLELLKGMTDWAKLDAMSEQEIERIAAKDEDSPPMTDEEWETALADAKRLGLGRFAPKVAKARS